MTHNDLFKLLSSVQKNIHCPQCGKSYQLGQIHIRGVVDSIIFLELTCGKHMPVLATVTHTPKAVKAPKGERVNANDVLATHEFLKDLPGGFEQIFKKTK